MAVIGQTYIDNSLWRLENQDMLSTGIEYISEFISPTCLQYGKRGKPIARLYELSTAEDECPVTGSVRLSLRNAIDLQHSPVLECKQSSMAGLNYKQRGEMGLTNGPPSLIPGAEIQESYSDDCLQTRSVRLIVNRSGQHSVSEWFAAMFLELTFSEAMSHRQSPKDSSQFTCF